MMELQVNRGEVSGTACLESSGHLIFSGVPVQGSGATVMFTVPRSAVQPCCANAIGATLVAREQSDGTLRGTLHFVGATADSDVTFSKGGDLCASAAPSP